MAALFFEKSQKIASGWVLLPQIPKCNMPELHQFAQHVAQLLRIFQAE